MTRSISHCDDGSVEIRDIQFEHRYEGESEWQPGEFPEPLRPGTLHIRVAVAYEGQVVPWKEGNVYREGDTVIYGQPLFDAFGRELHQWMCRAPSWLRPWLKRWRDRHLTGVHKYYYRAIASVPAEEPGPDSDQWEDVR